MSNYICPFTSNSNGGFSIIDGVFLVFLTLKLTGHIDWSWWWITAPLWGTVILMAFAKVWERKKEDDDD